MFIVFSVMVLGIVCGCLTRKVKQMQYTGKLITWFINLLLLFLGISVGHNKAIIANLSTIGWQALMITAGGLAGSIVLSWLVYNYFFRNRRVVKSDLSTLNE